MFKLETLYKGDIYKPYIPKILTEYLGDIKPSEIGVLDIETTGLSPLKNQFILGCIGSFTDEGLLAKQYFADDISEEKEVLTQFLDEIINYKILITYNGKSFDMNFIKKRMEHFNIRIDKQLPYNLDLYRFVKFYSSLQKVLPNLKQKTVENFMGYWEDRADEISGAESVDLYYEYCISKNIDIRDKILLHNKDDVAQLSLLMPIMKKCHMEQGLFSEGFKVNNLFVNEIKFKSTHLNIAGSSQKPINFIYYGDNPDLPDIKFKFTNYTWEASIPIIKKENFKVADLQKLNLPTSMFENSPNFQKGFIALQIEKNINHSDSLKFVKTICEKICLDLQKAK